MTEIPQQAPLEVSVVVVVPAGRPRPDECLESVRRHAPDRHEVVLVAVGDIDPPPGVRLVSLPGPVPFGAAADAGASVASGRVVCFVDPAARVTEGWLSPLIAAVSGQSPVDRAAAMAFPLVVSTDGRVAEAGAVLHRDGTVAAVGRGADPDRPDHRFARRTDGASATCVCVRRSAFSDAGGFDPRLDGLAAAGTDLAAVFLRSDRGAVYEPASRVVREVHRDRHPLVTAASPDGRRLAERWGGATPTGRPAAGSRPAEVAPDAAAFERVLVVAPCVPRERGPLDERRVDRLLADLAAVQPGVRLTLLAVDGHDATGRGPRLLARGVEVAAGAEDWDAWFDRRALLFTTVVLTDLRRLGAVEGHLDRTQPQALRVLAPPSLDFRDLGRLEATVTSPEEVDGFRLEVHLAEERLARRVASFDAVWCATRADRKWVAGVAPGTPCAYVPLAAEVADGPRFDGRSGYVMLAAGGADVVAGHEDAVATAVHEVLPALLARDPSAVLQIVVDEPTPGLQKLAGPGVELVPAGDDPARWFRRARVCLADYRHGSGAREAVALALDTATPFVTGGETLDGDLARLVPLVTATGGPAARAARLHEDPAAWQEAHTAVVQATTGPRSTAAARSALVRALATVGIVADRSALIDDPQPARGDAFSSREATSGPDGERAVVRPRRVPSLGSATPHCDDDDTLLPPDEQYRVWCERFGPTPARLDDITTRLAALPEGALVSVVLPVFNTDPVSLDEAIASVRAQLYDRWELCIGDDGSTRRETGAVLESHQAADPRVRVVRLPTSEGVVGASNAALSLATGDVVAFLAAGDLLKPHALAEIALHLDHDPDIDVLYTDDDTLDAEGRLVDPFFKPDWSPDHLLSRNYVGHLLVVRRTLLEKLGGLRRGYDGAHEHDLVLRAAEVTDRIAHIPEPVYTKRRTDGASHATAAARPWARDAAHRALGDALRRRGTPGEVVDGLRPGTTRVRFAVRGRPLVSVVIPTRDRVDLLRPCVEGVLERSTYTNIELIVVDNQSDDPETLAYLATLPGRVVPYPHRFNYARMMNLACAEARGDVLLLLNNDTEVVTPDWIESLLEHAQRPDVGIVGPRLRYPNGRVQHEGIITNFAGGMAGNVDHGGWWDLGDVVRDATAVTGACAMVRPSVYWAVGGHDERLRVAFNDVDLCLRIGQAGYDVVYTPHAELRHVEGGTRGVHAHEDDDAVFEGRWLTAECADRFYSPQLCRRHPFRIRN